MTTTSQGQRSTRALHVFLGLLALVLVVLIAGDLDNVRPVSGDDMWAVSVSHTFAGQGVLGSEMFRGFYGADRHHFVNLPAQHVLQALAFKMFGSGVAQARWVSVVSAIVLLWIVAVLAFRLGGVAAAVLSSMLFVFWRSGLTAPDFGLPLLTLARSARYDLTAVMWMWLTIFGLDQLHRRPHRGYALAVGLAAGMASLTQFFGVFVLPLVAVGLWSIQRRGIVRSPLTLWASVGFLAVMVPYVVYLAVHWPDAIGQIRYTHSGRIATSAGSAIWNIVTEPARFASVLHQASPGSWMLIVGVIPVCLYVGFKTRRDNSFGLQLLLLSLLVPALLLAIVDSTKAPIYAVPLIPPLCIAFGLALTDCVRWLQRIRRPIARVALVGIAGTTAVVMFEGTTGYAIAHSQARGVTRYEEVGRTIEATLPRDATALGATRWWWSLRGHSYLAFYNLLLQRQARSDQAGSAPSIRDLVFAEGIDAIVVNDNLRADLSRQPQVVQQQFSSLLADCARLERECTDDTYGVIAVYVISDCIDPVVEPAASLLKNP